MKSEQDATRGTEPAWAWVADASDGLGLAFAEALAARGYALLLIARRQDRLDTQGARLRESYGVPVRTERLDLADAKLADTITPWLNEAPPSLLVYNAAWAPTGAFLEQPLDSLARVVQVNVTGPLTFARLCGAAMVGLPDAGMVLMSSLAGEQGSPRIATYAASKAFNSTLAEGLWDELRREGIAVIGCVAGAIATPGYAAVSERPAPGTMSPAAIAETALAALGHGPVVVPGRFNRFTALLLGRWLPRRWAIAIMRRATRDLAASS